MNDTIRESGHEPGAMQAARPLGVPRRDFLLQSSAALVGASIVAAACDGSLAAAGILTTPAAPGALLSVGFCNPSLYANTVGQAWPLVPGESLRADGDYFKGTGEAALAIHGFWRAAGNTEPCSLYVLPRYPAHGCSSKINVLAWHYVDHGYGQASGSPRTITVPIGDDGVVELAIDHRAMTATAGAANTHPTAGTCAAANALAFGDVGEVLSFRTDRARSALKLRRGRYAIAIGVRPDWNAVAMVDTPGALSSEAGPLVTRSRREAVNFDYLSLSIA